MAGRLGILITALLATLALGVTAACAANGDRTIENPSATETAMNGTANDPSTTGTVTEGVETCRGFTLDNVLHSPNDGDIHYNVYIPDSYDGSKPYDGIDAVSSATVVAHEGEDYGAAQLAAKFVGDYTGADVSAIVTEQSYPAEYNAMADMAKAQRDNNERPALTSKIENLANYDTVFMVYPVWWYTVPNNAFVSAASGIAGQKAAIESWLDGLQEYWR